MRKVILIMFMVCILASCRRNNCICTIYQDCIAGHCQCGEWGEGDSCTPMRNKFIGTFAGTLSLNASNPVPDTIIFFGDGKPVNYVFSFTPNNTLISGFGIHLESSRTGIYYVDYKHKNVSLQYLDNSNPIDCGNAELSTDGRTLTLTYHPVLDPGVIDMINEYTFVGVKQ